MAALTQDRNTKYRDGIDFEFPVAANQIIFAGSMVGINAAGYAVKMSAITTLRSVGVAQAKVDNTGGASGDKNVRVRRGTFLFANGESIALTDVGATAYANDDQTLFKTSTGRSVTGIIRNVTSEGVWVEI